MCNLLTLHNSISSFILLADLCLNEPVWNKRPSGKHMAAVDMVKRIMEAKNYGIYRGRIYRKCDEAKHTMVFCCSVETFLLSILSNPNVADVVTPFVRLLTELLSKPACRLIKPIVIDFNFIEVLPDGFCFDIAKKTFTKDPPSLKGSPRAFVKYTYHEDRCPYPLKFVQGNLSYFYINHQIINFVCFVLLMDDHIVLVSFREI